MGATPFLSVVIPTYNRAEKLDRALASLASQTWADFEVIVCDDGSTDQTAAVVESFATKLAIRYLREENWGGPARPRNRGVEAAVGQWVCFLDADDWWYEGKLASVVLLTGEADFVYHDCDIHRPEGSTMARKRSRQLVPPVFCDLMVRGCSIVTSSVCVRRELLVQAGGFAEDKALVAIEDYDLWLRIGRLTDRFRYLPRALGAYWVDSENISEFSPRYIERETLLFQRHAPDLPAEERREAEILLAYRVGIARKYLGDFRESRHCFARALASRRFKIRLYAAFYYLLALVGSRYTIP